MSTHELTLARLQRRGQRFEVIIDPIKAYEFRAGSLKDLSQVIRYEEVFVDARKGKKASESDLKKAFGTRDFWEIVETIIKEGTIQLTEKQRKEMIEAKRKRIIDLISRMYVDPRTKLPHPPKRIELAMEEAKVRIDPFKPPQEQIKDVVDGLRRVLPLKSETVRLTLQIPAADVGRCYGLLKGYGEIVSESWLGDGSLKIVLDVSAAKKEELISEIGRRSTGAVKVNIS